MEFSYRISEKQYREALLLWRKSVSNSAVVKTILFWVFVLVCLMVLWVVVQHGTPAPPVAEDPAPATASSSTTLLLNVGPFVLLAGVWTFMLRGYLPWRMSKLYRKNPAMQSLYTVNVTADALVTENTAGVYSKTTWNLYEKWREGKDVAILIMHGGTYVLLGLAELAPAQREELRGILNAVLPRR